MLGRILERIKATRSETRTDAIQIAADRLEQQIARQEILLDHQAEIAERLQPFLHQLVAIQGGSLQPGPADGYVAPPVFLNTMPKSGSVFIMESLAKALDVPYVPVSPGYFPDDLLLLGAMRRLALGGAVTQCHCPPHATNIALMCAFSDRIVIHVRDPRQATLSWLHHVQTFQAQKDALVVLSPRLPEDYFDKDLAAQIDWQIDNHLPCVVQWLETWLKVAEGGKSGIRILFSTYEDFHGDPRKFLEKILAFYDVPDARYEIQGLEKTTGRNFRKGTIDEWREVFDPDQAERATAAIPDHMFERFGWRR